MKCESDFRVNLSGAISTGAYAFSCGDLILEENVVDLSPAAIQFESCGSTEFFSNQTSAGALVQAYLYTTNQPPTISVPELSTNVEDSVLLAF